MISAWVELTPIQYKRNDQNELVMIELTKTFIKTSSIKEITRNLNNAQTSIIIVAINGYNQNESESYTKCKESAEEVIQKIREAELEALKVFSSILQ